MNIDKDNFFISTKVFFKGCKELKRKFDYVSRNKYNGKISFVYWYGKNKYGSFVIRKSDHWSAYKDFLNTHKKGCNWIRSCHWFLKTTKKIEQNFVCGKAYFKNFTTI